MLKGTRPGNFGRATGKTTAGNKKRGRNIAGGACGTDRNGHGGHRTRRTGQSIAAAEATTKIAEGKLLRRKR